MKPAVLNFDEQVRGNSFDEVSVFIKENGIPVDLTNCKVKMQIKEDANSERFLKSLSETSGIDILPGGELKIKTFRIDMKKGKHVYDLVVQFPNNAVITYFAGQFPVLQNVSDI